MEKTTIERRIELFKRYLPFIAPDDRVAQVINDGK